MTYLRLPNVWPVVTLIWFISSQGVFRILRHAASFQWIYLLYRAVLFGSGMPITTVISENHTFKSFGFPVIYTITYGFQVGSSLGGYSLHQLQGDKQHGVTRSGYLHKKSEGKVRRVWQKRRCRVTGEGFLDIFHADENKPPARVNLLTCQIKVASDDKRAFDLVSCMFIFNLIST